MRFWWTRQRRTAGIAVDPGVHRLLRQGDAARGVDWISSANAYRRALDMMPALPHIWIQLGHAYGELGDSAAAMAAYHRSIVAGGDRGEGHVHLGHVANRVNDLSAAAWHYGMALRHGRDDGLAAMAQRLRPGFTVDAAHLRAALVDLANEAPEPGATGEPATDQGLDIVGAVVTYDVSDLIAHFRHHRLPTGIQRFQVEVLARVLEATDIRARICCFVGGRSELVELPRSLFTDLSNLSRSGGDVREPAWLAVLAKLALVTLISPAYRFVEGECLVNLGTSWSEHDYFLMVRTAKASHSITFITTVFDLIPVYAPQFCVTAITQEYINWLTGVFFHTNRFVAISQATADDLARAARQLGHELDAKRIAVVPLDADFRSDASDGTSDLPARLGLTPGGYALMVSTIEPRKNHMLALRAWTRLLRRYPSHRIPPLVLAGRPGWLNERIYGYLEEDPALAAKVLFVEGAGDADLAALYRGCAFTVYPSLYEGWGLPVTESLCYGKLPVVSDNSSLPEAGGAFASFFESNSLDDFVSALEQAIFDVDWRRAREVAIAEQFRPRTWRQIADSIIELASPDGAGVVPVGGTAIAHGGRLYPLGLYRSVGIWSGLDSGDRFRIGGGWLPPERDCCRLKPGRAMLRIEPAHPGSWTMVLLLKGMATQQAPFRIAAGDVTAHGAIDPGTMRWTKPITIVADDSGPMDLVIDVPFGEPQVMLEDGIELERIAAIGVAGIYLCPADDTRAFSRVLSAGLTGDLSAISTFSRMAGRGGPMSTSDKGGGPSAALLL